MRIFSTRTHTWACTIKHYRLVIYGKLINYVVSFLLLVTTVHELVQTVKLTMESLHYKSYSKGPRGMIKTYS
jgi:hypothetical protein